MDMIDTGMEETPEVTPEEPVAVDVQPQDNRWAALEELGVEPEKLADTWKNYTQKTQELSSKEKELQPYRELAEEIRNNRELQAILNDYYEKGANPAQQLEAVQSQMSALQFEMKMERDFANLHKFVQDNDLPPFEDDKVMEYMAQHEIYDPSTAYRAMAFDEIRNVTRDQTIEEIKKSQGAPPVKGSGRGDDNSLADKPVTTKDISSMSGEEFIKNYDSIMKQLLSE